MSVIKLPTEPGATAAGGCIDASRVNASGAAALSSAFGFLVNLGVHRMTLNQVMAQLEKWGSEKRRKLNKRHGAGDQQLGLNCRDIRKLAAQIKQP